MERIIKAYIDTALSFFRLPVEKDTSELPQYIEGMLRVGDIILVI